MATLRDIQKHELGMLKKFKSVCDKHSIKYYIAGGTLLGAVREKAFIPWDDDIDVNLPIKDYKRLKKLCKKELPDYFFWQDWKSDRNHNIIWAKVRDTRTKICAQTSDGKKHIEDGIFFDIFPLVYAARSSKLYNLQLSAIFLLEHFVSNQKKIKDIEGSSIFSKLFQLVREVLVYRPCGQLMYWLMLLLQNKKSDRLIVLDFSFFEKNKANINRVKRVMIHDGWLSAEYYEFENERFMSYSDYDTYLINLYGNDYMTPIKMDAKLHVDLEKTETPMEL